MKQCAFLTTDNLEEFFVYDDLVKPHLANLGWAVTAAHGIIRSIQLNLLKPSKKLKRPALSFKTHLNYLVGTSQKIICAI